MGSEIAFSKECDIPSQGLKWQYVPNLGKEGGPHLLEGRETGHEVISLLVTGKSAWAVVFCLSIEKAASVQATNQKEEKALSIMILKN